MKRILISGLLTILAFVTVIASGENQVFSQENSTPIVESPAEESAQVSHNDVFYYDGQFGFRFTQPRGYVNEISEIPTDAKNVVNLLQIWNRIDFLNRDYTTETPPIIQITVSQNPQQLPLEQWKGELSHDDDRAVTVADQAAIAYSSTGLYESDNVIFNSPDGQYVFRIQGSYMEAHAPIRRTFQDIVSSFYFDQIAIEPGSAQLNYSRLQTLLAAQNWQAADVETRGLLQREFLSSTADYSYGRQAMFDPVNCEVLQTIDRLWTEASSGHFGYTTQASIWQEVVANSAIDSVKVNQFAQQVGWRKPPESSEELAGSIFSGSGWRLDTELTYDLTAPAGHLPWSGISTEQLSRFLEEGALGCGSCTIDAMYLANDRPYDMLPALFNKLKNCSQT